MARVSRVFWAGGLGEPWLAHGRPVSPGIRRDLANEDGKTQPMQPEASIRRTDSVKIYPMLLGNED